MDEQAVDRSLALDDASAHAARESWLALMNLVVWGDVKAADPGTLPRVRKRALDAGERLRSMFARRDWIPRPRERLKNALASFLALHQSLDQLGSAIGGLTAGADLGGVRNRYAELRAVADRLGPAAAQWSALLDAQYRDAAD